jgi:hypothetical protein
VVVAGSDEVTLVVRGREIDRASGDDALGTVRRTLLRDALIVIADLGATRIGMPVLTGDGGEYQVDLVLSVEARSRHPSTTLHGATKTPDTESG